MSRTTSIFNHALNNNDNEKCFYKISILCIYDSISVPSGCCIYHEVDYVFDQQLYLLDLWFSLADFLLLRTGPSFHHHQQPVKAYEHELSMWLFYLCFTLAKWLNQILCEF